MANNPYVNKVQKADGTTIIDISTDTAVAADVLAGKYFHLATGERVAGTNSGGSGDGYVWQDANGYVHLSDEEGTQPIYDTLNVSASGTFTPAQGHAYNSVVVPSGTSGTPTATKGTVSNHSVSITPSVTNTAGYISGGTKTGTPVTVSVSELESGTKSITENGTGISVSGYSSVDVAVTGSGNTCTITSTGSSNTVFVTYNNTRYYTINDTFTFNGGDTLLLTCTRGNDNYIILNGEYIESALDSGISSYSFTLPDCDIEISFRVSNGYSSITISAPYTTITSNGMHDVSGYGYVKVVI